MGFRIYWKNINVALLYGDETHVKYKILFENLPKAKEQGLIVRTILNYPEYNVLPTWINNRIPKSISNKFEYLRQTQGRLETDEFWFQAV